MPAKTLIIMKVKPADMERIDETLAELKKVSAGELKDARKEDIGFGIQIITAGFLISEKDEHALETLEKAVNALKTVDEAEVTGMTLL